MDMITIFEVKVYFKWDDLHGFKLFTGNQSSECLKHGVCVGGQWIIFEKGYISAINLAYFF